MRRADYAAARAQIAQSGKGPFTNLTLLLLDAWSAEGAGDTKAALADLKEVTAQGGTDVLSNFHRALILDLSGDNAGAETAYVAALGNGAVSPRIAEAYGRFLERASKVQEARAFYTKMLADGAIAPIATDGLARLDAGRKP